MKQLYLITLIIFYCTGKLYGQTGVPVQQTEEQTVRSQTSEIIIDQKDSYSNTFRIDTLMARDRSGKRKHTRIYEKDGNSIVITTFNDGDSLQRQNTISVTQSNAGNKVRVIQSGQGNSVSISQYSLKKEH
jgi:hypothetical protein